MIVEIIKGDITEVKVDAIVNAANTSLLGGGGVDGAIHRKGGKAILDDCVAIRNRQGGCKVGDAVITTAGNLPSKFVIHTVGPVWNNGKSLEKELLENCYLSVLELALANNVKTIAFPNISTGIYKFPKDLAAEIALTTIQNFQHKSKFEKIIFVCFDDENFKIYNEIMESDFDYKIKSGLFGVAVGDALGVPYEFLSRDQLKKSPAVDMIGYGTHSQPAGTWSDDSSLTFCLAETLVEEYELQKLANRFVNWKEHNYWTPYNEVFDIGIATSIAIHELHCGKDPVLAGGFSEESNGNGSLMRILPLLFYIKDMSIEQRFLHTKEVSSLTHRHIRSIMACFIYLEYALQLYNGKNKDDALKEMQEIVKSFFENAHMPKSEIDRFHRILSIKVGNYDIQPIESLSESEIFSSGYVLNTLEAAIWCILQTNNYKDAVLKAVNLGEDTDTTGAIAGGLAGIYYGFKNIPEKWIETIARKNDIEDLSQRLSSKLKD